MDEGLEKNIKTVKEDKKKYRWWREILFLIIYSFILYMLSFIIKTDDIMVHLELFFLLISKGGIPYIMVAYLIILSIMFIIKSLIQDNFKTSLISTIIVFVITIISYYKYNVLELPFLPGDILLIGNIKQIAEFGLSNPPINMIISIFIIFLMLVLLYIIQKKYPVVNTKNNIQSDTFRIIICVTGIALLYYMCIRPTRYIDLGITNELGCNYAWMGGNAVFFMHIGDVWSKPPSGYTRENIEKMKKESEEHTNMTEDKNNPNVIIIMSESFSNPNKLKNVGFSINPIQNIEQLAQNNKNCITGNIITAVYGGGTSLPEYEVLTGLSSYFIEEQIIPYTNYIRSDMNSIVRTYYNNNYTTVGIHTNTKKFYNRENVYKYLGFEQTVFSEDIDNPEIKGGNISDNEFSNQIIKKFEENDGSKFIFGVTMQNHLPYTRKNYENYDIDVIANDLTEEEYIKLKNYVQGVYDIDQMYIKLVNYLKNIEEPTILMMFGDHLPSLNSIHTKSDYNAIDYYTVPYIIWSNYDINYEAISETTSPSNISIDIMKLANINIPWYLTKFDKMYDNYPAINNKYAITKKNEVLEYNDIIKLDIMNDCEVLQYDLLMKKKYIPVE